MATKTLNVTLLLRNDPAAVWASNNPVLSKGEMGVEIDTRKFKIGDGLTPWNSLKYASSGSVEVKSQPPTAADFDYDVGAIWLDVPHNKAFILFAKTTTATWLCVLTPDDIVLVGEAIVAQKLKTAQLITLIGDVGASAAFDGSSGITLDVVLKNSGATAGTFTKLTINSKGIVTGATTLAASDIPSLTLSKISDAGTAAAKNVGTGAGQIPVLEADGKLNTSVLPAIAVTDTFVVASQSAMLALAAEKGDIAIRTDLKKSFILTKDPASTLANWSELQTPDCAVESVNGKKGVIVLTTSDITEGTNKYYTDARANAAFDTKIANTSVTALKDGATVVTTADTLVLDGGNA